MPKLDSVNHFNLTTQGVFMKKIIQKTFLIVTMCSVYVSPSHAFDADHLNALRSLFQVPEQRTYMISRFNPPISEANRRKAEKAFSKLKNINSLRNKKIILEHEVLYFRDHGKLYRVDNKGKKSFFTYEKLAPTTISVTDKDGYEMRVYLSQEEEENDPKPIWYLKATNENDLITKPQIIGVTHM